MTATQKTTVGILAAATALLLIRNTKGTMGVGGLSRQQKTFHEILRKKLLAILDTPEESLAEIRHYMEEYPSDPDFHLAQSATMPCTYWEIKEMLRDSGYAESTIKRLESSGRLWDMYLANVGLVASILVPGVWKYTRSGLVYKVL